MKSELISNDLNFIHINFDVIWHRMSLFYGGHILFKIGQLIVWGFKKDLAIL